MAVRRAVPKRTRGRPECLFVELRPVAGAVEHRAATLDLCFQPRRAVRGRPPVLRRRCAWRRRPGPPVRWRRARDLPGRGECRRATGAPAGRIPPPPKPRAAAGLLVVGLQQRLLSSAEAFARSLRVHAKPASSPRTAAAPQGETHRGGRAAVRARTVEDGARGSVRPAVRDSRSSSQSQNTVSAWPWASSSAQASATCGEPPSGGWPPPPPAAAASAPAPNRQLWAAVRGSSWDRQADRR